jgi:D-3-phosphoglycerate dehydrogenase
MTVLTHSRSLTAATAQRCGVQFVSRETLLAKSDFLSLHLPLSQTTHKIINRDAFRAMKRGSVLINTSRGGLVDEIALVDALQSSHLSGALLDVYQNAPLPLEHPLRQCGNVILTPHVAFYSEGALADLRQRAATEMQRQLMIRG